MDAQALGEYFSTLSYHAPVMIVTTEYFSLLEENL